MRTNIEIEFKCKIDEATYNHLLNKLNLHSRIFLQTNYYFDTIDNQLLNQKLVLRIRQKPNDNYKLTLKSQKETSVFERHIFLTKEKALELLTNGFNTADYFDFKMDVKHMATLENYRVSTVYENGKLFFDKCVYNNTTDYEIEYESLEYDKGLLDFKKFLEDEKIPFQESKKKSERAFNR